MNSKSLLPLLALLSVAKPTPVPSPCPQSQCKDLIVPITASGNLMVLPPFNSTTADPLQYISGLNFSSIPHKIVSGIFNISMRYCVPSVEVEGRQNTIQMLLHGVAYTKVSQRLFSTSETRLTRNSRTGMESILHIRIFQANTPGQLMLDPKATPP
jgi:hypothetical protein